VLFGEAFGDLGARLGMRPILLHRRDALLSFLALAVGVGLVHVALGTAIGAVHALRRGHLRHALERAGRLVLLGGAAAAALAVGGVLSRAALVPSLAVAGGGALLSLAGGPMALLEVVLSLGNVLSYHVTDGRRFSNSVFNRNSTKMLEMLNGQYVVTNPNLTLTDNAGQTIGVVAPLVNINASNGVIHVIDKVLLP